MIPTIIHPIAFLSTLFASLCHVKRHDTIQIFFLSEKFIHNLVIFSLSIESNPSKPCTEFYLSNKHSFIMSNWHDMKWYDEYIFSYTLVDGFAVVLRNAPWHIKIRISHCKYHFLPLEHWWWTFLNETVYFKQQYFQPVSIFYMIFFIFSSSARFLDIFFTIFHCFWYTQHDKNEIQRNTMECKMIFIATDWEKKISKHLYQ